MTASAREEAERLVATMLAMAASGGLGAAARASGDSSGTRDAVTAGLGALADTVSGFVGRLASVGQEGPDQSGAGQSGAGQGGARREGAGQGGTSQEGAGQGGVRRDGSGAKPAESQHRGWATGSAECCVCPVCRAIAAVRDPSPETAVKIAISAGDLATSVAGMMRALSSLAGERPRPKPATSRPASRPAPDPGQTWAAATRTTAPVAEPDDTHPGDAELGGTGPDGAELGGTGPDGAEPGGTGPGGAELGGTGSGGGELGGTGLDDSARGRRASGDAARAEARLVGDPWAAASAADAAEVQAERLRARRAADAARRKAAKAAREAAAEAARRVAEAAALAEAAKAEAARARAEAAKADAAKGGGAGAAERGASETGAVGSGVGGTAGAKIGVETGDTGAGGRGSRRTPQGFDVWAAATADAGVGDVAGAASVDHDVPGAAVGDEASGDGAT
jgi:hypothetical protein